MTAHPRRLTLLYDGHCSLCRHCRAWLAPQRKFVDMDFLAQGGPQATRRFPHLRLKRNDQGAPEELVVVADDGRVWRGDGAWLMVLWALREYRALSVRLAKNPVTGALARRAFAFISHHRQVVNGFLPESKEDALVRGIQTPAGAAFERKVMVCALPNQTLSALQAAKPPAPPTPAAGELRQAYRQAQRQSPRS